MSGMLQSYTYVNSRRFRMGVGRNYRTPSATILTYSSSLVHIHTSDHTRNHSVQVNLPFIIRKVTRGICVFGAIASKQII